MNLDKKNMIKLPKSLTKILLKRYPKEASQAVESKSPIKISITRSCPDDCCRKDICLSLKIKTYIFPDLSIYDLRPKGMTPYNKPE